MPQNVSDREMLGLLYQKGVDHESVGLVSGIIGIPYGCSFWGYRFENRCGFAPVCGGDVPDGNQFDSAVSNGDETGQ